VKAGIFESGEDHYVKAGAFENRRGGFSGWDEEGYLIPYGDVRDAVLRKEWQSGFAHYLVAGPIQKRNLPLGLPSLH